MTANATSSRRSLLRVAVAGASSFAGLLLVATLGLVMAVTGASLGCPSGESNASAGGHDGPIPTRAARRQIPPSRLTLYRAAGARFRIDWTFVASIGAQECDHGSCAGDNGYGCSGPMQIATRRGSPCSPGSEPTEWDRFGFDGDHDGRLDVNDPADAIYTAARVLLDKGAPHTGGTYAQYREAACRYYGACGDGVAAYADEVMRRAVLYGFHGTGSPATNDTEGAAPVPDRSAPTRCGSDQESAGGGDLGQRIVKVARSQLGTGERPAGSNCTKYGPCEEWCALFTAWVWQRAGSSLPGSPSQWAYTGSLYVYAKEHGNRVRSPREKPAPGDAVLYGSGPGPGASAHVGIVERVLPDGRIATIDGNSSDTVRRIPPFDPARAEEAGLPGPIYGYARPPAAAKKTGAAHA